MQRILLYEFISANQIGVEPHSPQHSLFLEGSAMIHALEDDLQNLADMECRTFPPTADPAVHHDLWQQLIEWSDGVWAIAPETDGILARLAQSVRTAGRHWLGCSPDAIALTGDKFQLAQHWMSHNVPTPQTELWAGQTITQPSILKPRDGAGSEHTQLVTSTNGIPDHFPNAMILQRYHPGRAASVTCIVSTEAVIALTPAWQDVQANDDFHYRGGSAPIPAEFAERVIRIAQQAITVVPGLRGYVGVDVILGDDASGKDDVVIEINPRLTTSYVGLRHLYDIPLAQLILSCFPLGVHPMNVGVCQGNLQVTWKPTGVIEILPN